VQLEFKYKEIASWASTKTNFAFLVGDLDAQKKYVFRTDQVPLQKKSESVVSLLF